MFDDDGCAVEGGADDLAVAGPEGLDAFARLDPAGAGESCGGVEPCVLGVHGEGRMGLK